MGQFKSPRYTASGNTVVSNPTDHKDFEDSVIEATGLAAGVAFTGRQLAKVDGTAKVTDRLAYEGVASGLATLDAGVLVPLAQIPATLTGKDADTIDTYHAAALEKVANKGAANGYAPLDSGLFVPRANVPAEMVAVATRSTTQSVSSGVDTAVVFDAAQQGPVGVVSWVVGSPTRLTIPTGRTGHAVVLASIAFDNTSSVGNRQLYIKKNGVTFLVAQMAPASDTGTYCKIAASTLEFFLSEGDYIEAIVYQNSGVALNLAANWCRLCWQFVR